ncbi:Alpha/beta hydrolase family-domain-containing protein [Mycena epipterygia]|nr:Alpha/beta hydrolase family-domain-containing protein [Mycena epipterygia]
MGLEITSVVFTCPQDEQSAPGNFLKMTAKRYTSPYYSTGIGGLTLIFAHGVGGYKEQWEPMISEIFRLQHSKAPHHRIHEAWALDRQNHGDSALLNKEALSTSRPGGVSSYEWADAIAAFARSSRMRGKRLVAISHSAGALATQGRINEGNGPFRHTLCCIEKTVMGFSAATKTRRDKWPSREVAYQWMKARYPWRVWDPRMLQALIVLNPLLEILLSEHFLPQDHGLTETSDGEVTPKCGKHQESSCYPDTFAHFDSMKQINRIWRTVPLHIIWGTRNDELIPDSARGSVSDPSKGRGAASVIRMKGGHMLVQENPDYLASTICQVLDKVAPVPDKAAVLTDEGDSHWD